jgi:citrate synthase
MSTTTGAGLEGVIAGESEICYHRRVCGHLSYRGYNIHTLLNTPLSKKSSTCCGTDGCPRRTSLAALKSELAANRTIPRTSHGFSGQRSKAVPMDVLRTAVSMLSCTIPLATDSSPEANQMKAKKLLAQTPTIVSSFRPVAQRGKPVIDPDPSLSLAGNFLYTLTWQAA